MSAEQLPPQDVAAAVTAYLARPGKRTAAALARTGAAGVTSVLGWWFGPARPDRPGVDGVPDRELADRWRGVIAVVAHAEPAAFMDALAGTSLARDLVDVLGGVDDPRALDALVRLTDDPDWLVRHGALRALAHHAGSNADAAVERGLGDTEAVVRWAAIEALTRRDPARARDEAARLAADPGCTTALRAEIRRRYAR